MQSTLEDNLSVQTTAPLPWILSFGDEGSGKMTRSALLAGGGGDGVSFLRAPSSCFAGCLVVTLLSVICAAAAAKVSCGGGRAALNQLAAVFAVAPRALVLLSPSWTVATESWLAERLMVVLLGPIFDARFSANEYN